MDTDVCQSVGNPAFHDTLKPMSASDRPLVSVCVLCFNHRRWVVEALDSVLQQTYSPIELIVMDDGSTDGSADVIKDWVNRRWPHAQVIINAENSGRVSANLNRMVQRARGEYLAAFAADDRMRPDRISRQVEAMAANPKAVLSFGAAHLIDEMSNSLGSDICGVPLPFAGDLLPYLVGGNCIPACTVMIRRDALMMAGGYDEGLLVEDYDMWLRLAKSGDGIGVTGVVSDYRRVGTSISNSRFAEMHRCAEHSLMQFCRRNRLSSLSRRIAALSVMNILCYRKERGGRPRWQDTATLLRLRCTPATIIAAALLLAPCTLPWRPVLRLLQRLIRRLGIVINPKWSSMIRRTDFWLRPHS